MTKPLPPDVPRKKRGRKPKAVSASAASNHALDRAPVNSKIVGTDRGTALATPDGVTLLPKSDVAGMLPAGARIQKLGPTRFVATQLDPAIPYPEQEYATATAAILDFLPHFHGRAS